jgi:anthranilate phosphoribosyltransferase
MSDALKPYLSRLMEGVALPEDMAEEAFTLLMTGAATDAQIGAFLASLRLRGETVPELVGAARVLRAKARSISAPPGTIDTCGTGGDAKGTVNISTAVALVVAGCGVPVAKHGNRAASSRSGAADVLEALGVDLEAEIPVLERCLAEANICFLMAPQHHSAMRHVAAARKELGFRTIFNLLGPLANPAGARRQLMGVFADHWLEPMAATLQRLGCEAAWVVHGSDGLDELTVSGPSRVAELRGGRIQSFEITPDEAGLRRHRLGDLAGGTPAENARALEAVLDGKTGAYRDVTLLNAAAALVIAGRVPDLAAGAAKAAECIDSGAARKVLDRLIAFSRGEAA